MLTPNVFYFFFQSGVIVCFINTAGDLRSLKEKIQANMKIQRAEVRKVYESQRKIDDEEISEEEEEDDFEEDEGKQR